MKIRCEEYNRVGVLTPSGDLRAEQADELKKCFSRMIERRQISDFVLDCQSVGFIDSTMLEALLDLRRKAQASFGRLALANLDAGCRQILHVTRLADRFECHPNLLGALAALR